MQANIEDTVNQVGMVRSAEIAALLEPPNTAQAGATRKKSAKLPSPAAHCEATSLAVLRPAWSSRDMLAVDYRGREVRSELTCGGQVLWAGRCNPRIAIDGVELLPASDWENLCWVSDDDADYLELQLELLGGVRVQRQLLFARQDRFLFAADAVLCERPATIDYGLTLPLADGVAFLPGEQAREGFLASSGGRRRAQALPLALSEWRGDARCGELAGGERGLDLRLTAPTAQALYAPLFIDLSPRRFSLPVTWRQLTVAEDRLIVSRDVAVGYRVQIGRSQWLFYRSLAECGNRTLLGQNLVSEFLAARFGRDGIAEPLMEIEATPDDQ
ncbi:MAG TPA: hypothetical protein VJ783_27555 [Pirellulales bacterium]|nr:hypothetical protein [Pirellulales bacterium]